MKKDVHSYNHLLSESLEDLGEEKVVDPHVPYPAKERGPWAILRSPVIMISISILIPLNLICLVYVSGSGSEDITSDEVRSELFEKHKSGQVVGDVEKLVRFVDTLTPIISEDAVEIQIQRRTNEMMERVQDSE